MELEAFTGFCAAGTHFDDHSGISAGMLARLAEKSKNALCGNLVTLWKLAKQKIALTFRN